MTATDAAGQQWQPVMLGPSGGVRKRQRRLLALGAATLIAAVVLLAIIAQVEACGGKKGGGGGGKKWGKPKFGKFEKFKKGGGGGGGYCCAPPPPMCCASVGRSHGPGPRVSSSSNHHHHHVSAAAPHHHHHQHSPHKQHKKHVAATSAPKQRKHHKHVHLRDLIDFDDEPRSESVRGSKQPPSNAPPAVAYYPPPQVVYYPVPAVAPPSAAGTAQPYGPVQPQPQQRHLYNAPQQAQPQYADSTVPERRYKAQKPRSPAVHYDAQDEHNLDDYDDYGDEPHGSASPNSDYDIEPEATEQFIDQEPEPELDADASEEPQIQPRSAKPRSSIDEHHAPHQAYNPYNAYNPYQTPPQPAYYAAPAPVATEQPAQPRSRGLSTRLGNFLGAAVRSSLGRRKQ